jgi:hypothetical protein
MHPNIYNIPLIVYGFHTTVGSTYYKRNITYVDVLNNY